MSEEAPDSHLHDRGIYYCIGVSGQKWKLGSPSRMVEPLRLEVMQKQAKCEQIEHEPTVERMISFLSYSRKRVSRGLFVSLSWIPASAGMANKGETKQVSTSSRPAIRTPRLQGEGGFSIKVYI
jgi:hypothetical protein